MWKLVDSFRLLTAPFNTAPSGREVRNRSGTPDFPAARGGNQVVSGLAVAGKKCHFFLQGQARKWTGWTGRVDRLRRASADDLQRRSDNWFGPFRDQLEITRTDNLARSHMQEELRLRTLARVWISFAAVVVNE